MRKRAGEPGLKVLIILASSTGDFGGLEKHAAELAGALARRGHQITFASLPVYHAGLPPDIHRASLPASSSRRSPRLLWRLHSLIAKGGFDIVHAQGTKAAKLIQSIAPFSGPQRYIATVHNFKSRYPGPGPFSAIIAVSKALATDIGFRNTRVIYNGIAPSGPGPDPGILPEVSARPLWLAVGRLVPAKGFDLLVSAFSDVPGTLWIAGEGPERKRLEQQIVASGQQERIQLLGHSDRIPGLLHRSDRLVISSRREGFSYVFAEALSAGLPVVATDVPVANEFLPPQLICHRLDPVALAAVMRALDGHLSLLSGPRERARQLLTLDAMSEQTEALYREAAGNPPGNPVHD